METTITENKRNTAALIHISTFAKYFFPFGNFIAPLIIWSFNKENPFIDQHGKQALNFQLSILLYMLGVGLLCIPFVVIFASDFISVMDALDHSYHHVNFHDVQNFSGYILLFFLVIIMLAGLLLFEIYGVINATIHASRGELYKYPLSIPFIR